MIKYIFAAAFFIPSCLGIVYSIKQFLKNTNDSFENTILASLLLSVFLVMFAAGLMVLKHCPF